jgi:hypothetical protein
MGTWAGLYALLPDVSVGLVLLQVRHLAWVNALDELAHPCNFDSQCRDAAFLGFVWRVCDHTAKWAVRHVISFWVAGIWLQPLQDDCRVIVEVASPDPGSYRTDLKG